MASVVILGSAHPLRGGLSSYNERLAREFLLMGHEVTIYTFSLQYPSLLFPGKTQLSASPKPPDLDIRVCVNSINPLNWIQVGRTIARQKPDVLITKYWLPFMAGCLGTICRMVKKNKHTKIICILDNLIPHEKRPGDKQLTHFFMNGLDACIAQSNSVLKDVDLFSKTIPRRLCPHPIFDNFGEPVSRDQALRYLGLDHNYRYMLFFGFIREYKGLDILLQAFAQLHQKHPQLKLIVAGEFYVDRKSYLNLIESLQLTEVIELRTDFIRDEDVRYYFCASDLVVQPYKHATQSGVTQICYHFNKPMLVTHVGGLADIVPDGIVGYVTPVSADAVANAISDFYDHNRMEMFSVNVQSEKLKYSWRNMVNHIFDLCEEIVP